MPLRQSRQFSEDPSYSALVWRQVLVWLTGSVFAVGWLVIGALDLLGIIAVGDFMREHQPSPWWILAGILVIALVTLNVAQWRAGLELQRQLKKLSAPLNRHHPSVDDGIDVTSIRAGNHPFAADNSGRYLQVDLKIQGNRYGEIIVFCDGTFERAEFAYGLQNAVYESATINTPQSFMVPVVAFWHGSLRIYGDSSLTVASIEWLH